jgi:hypothetical protein
MKKLLMACSGFCVMLFAFYVYNDIMVPAWLALIWAGATFVHDYDAYKREKAEQEFIDVVKLNEEVR